MSSPPIQAITFDVGGTLITPWRSVGHIYAEVAAAHGCVDLSPQVLNQRFAAAWKAAKRFGHSRAEWAQLVDATFYGLIHPPPSLTFFDELYERFAEATAWHVFEDVVPTLQALRSRRFKLGIISNWDERLRPLLRRLQLYDYFDSIIVSYEIGAPKPAGVLFDRAADELGIAGKSILHIGDSMEMDVHGAAAAGFAAVLLDREANSASPGIVASLGDLPELL